MIKRCTEEDQHGKRWVTGLLGRRKLVLMMTACALVSALALTACGGGSNSSSTTAENSGGGNEESNSSGEDITYGFSHPVSEAPVVAAVKSLVQEDGEANGWNVLLDATKGGNIQEQTATVETWITQGVSAITVLPSEPTAFEAMAKRATEAGIIWTTYQEKMKEGAGGALFPADISGRIVGEAAVKWINENDPKAEVLVLKIEGVPSLAERTSIPAEMIEEETEATIVGTQAATEEAKGLQITEDMLQAHPNLSVVIAINDDGALGAAEAFRKGSDKEPSEVFIIGQDGTEDGLKALSDPQSYFRASSALNLNELAEETVGVAARALEKHWQPGDEQEWVDIEPTLIENGDTSLINKFLAAFK